MDKKEPKLTPKQEMFCLEYMKDLNATQACIRAGYSEKTSNEQGAQNLAKLSIQQRIAELLKTRTQKLEIDAEWVLKRFKEISDRCMVAEPVMTRDEDGQMVESGEFTFDSSGANKATEMIGKHIGFFEKDNSLNVKVEKKMSVEDVVLIMAEAEKKLEENK